MKTSIILFVAVMVAHFTLAAFVQQPIVTREDGVVKLKFALDKPTDVEIAVVDGEGKVIRHLAAGFLGGATPPPVPLGPSLEQVLVWDGKNDDGVAVAVTDVKFRVRSGMSVRYGRTIGGDPATGIVGDISYRAPLNGLVADTDGRVLVLMASHVGSHGNSGLWPWHLRRFSKDGKYVKTVLPYAASSKPEQAAGFELIERSDGSLTPSNYNSLYPVLFNFGDEIANRLTPDGRVVFVNSHRKTVTLFNPKDGSVESRPMWVAKGKPVFPAWLNVQVATSPDGRSLYYSNLAATPYDGKKPEDIKPEWPQGRIYRQDLTNLEKDPEVFFDMQMPDFEKTKYWMPSAWDKKSAAAGIDVDANNNVLVCDLVNNQVVEIGPDGRQRSVTSIPWPDKIAVARRGNQMYVISREISRGFVKSAKLLRIDGRGEAAVIKSEMKFQGSMGGSITLDESGTKPVIWVGGGQTVMRVEDNGDELVTTHANIINQNNDAIGFMGYLSVDREQELVYVTGSASAVWRYNGLTGEGGFIPIKAVELTIGPKGMIYTWGDKGGYAGPITRYNSDFTPAPLEAIGNHKYGELSGRAGRGSAVCGMAVDHKGRVFAVDGSNKCYMRLYDADGQPANTGITITNKTNKGAVEIPVFVDQVSGYGGSIRVDREGNVYLLQPGWPKSFQPDAEFAKNEAYKQTAGTIIKFGATGARRIDQLDEGGRGGDSLGFTNIRDLYPDCGPISGWRCDGTCACTKTRFDVDDFGRLYIPNAITFQVSVRDNAGNQILRFGNYGNFDSQGPDSVEPKPDIPLGWPLAVGVSENHIYVGDCLNHRIVRVDKQWKETHLCAVPKK